MLLIDKLIILYVLSLFSGELTKIPGSNFPLSITDLLGAIVIIIFVSKNFKKLGTIKFPRFLQPLILFILIAFCSLLLAFSRFTFFEVIISGLYLIRFINLWLIALITAIRVESNKKFSQNLTKIIGLGGLIFIFIGYLQLWLLPDFTKLPSSLGFDPHQFRFASTFFDPNFAGCLLVLLILFGFSNLVSIPKQFRLTSLILVVSASIALFFTYSRSAYLMALIALPLFSIVRKSWISMICILVIGVGIVGFSPRARERVVGAINPDVTATARIESWQKTYLLFLDHPILGNGFNTLRFSNRDKGYFTSLLDEGGNSGGGSDSSILFILATTGVIGMIAYLILLMEIIFTSFMYRKTNFHSLVFVGLIGLLVESNFINSMFYPPIIGLMLIFIGNSYGIKKE